MSLTITAGELLTARPALLDLGNYAVPDIKGSYALTKIKRAANTALEDLEAARVELCDRHATKDEAGASTRDADGNYDIGDRAGFAADWNTLMAQPVELVGCRALTVEEFSGATQVIRDAQGKVLEIVHGVPADLLFLLGPIVTETAPGPDAPKKN